MFDNPYFPQTFDIGTPGAGHIHFAQDGSLTLFGADGVTVEASLTPANGLQVFKGTITGALVQTATPGNKRIALDGPNDQIIINSGTAGETDGTIVLDHVAALGSTAPRLTFTTPENAGVATVFRMTAGAGVIPRQVDFSTDFFTVDDGTHHLFFENGGVDLNLANLTAEFESLAGAFGEFLSADGQGTVIAGTDYVLLHSHNANSVAAPRVWGYNPVIQKDVDTLTAPGANVIGIEISVTNNTGETAFPQRDGELTGLYISYINALNTASAALSIGGLGGAGGATGWMNGIWIDAINNAGTAISVHDDATGSGMATGLDLTGVAGGFTTAAIALGNERRIRGLTTLSAIRDMMFISNANELIIGDTGVTLPVRVFATAFKLNLPAVAIAGSAVAGTAAALPGNPQNYCIVTINNVDYKIALWKV